MWRGVLLLLCAVACLYNTSAEYAYRPPVYISDSKGKCEAAHEGPKVCLASMFALDFEKYRIFDWIAYHHLIDIDCFFLYMDKMNSNITHDPVSKETFEMLNSSNNIVIFDAEIPLPGEGRSINNINRLPNAWIVKKFKCDHLVAIDVDEFVVVEPSVDMEMFEQNRGKRIKHPYRLKPFLKKVVPDNSVAGVYLHRYDYGTNGIKHVPKYKVAPFFSLYIDRMGGHQRIGGLPLGKMIFHIPSGVKIQSVHRYQGVEDGILMVFPNGSKQIPGMGLLADSNLGSSIMWGNNTVMGPVRVNTPQPVYVNHFATGKPCLPPPFPAQAV